MEATPVQEFVAALRRIRQRHCSAATHAGIRDVVARMVDDAISNAETGGLDRSTLNASARALQEIQTARVEIVRAFDQVMTAANRPR